MIIKLPLGLEGSRALHVALLDCCGSLTNAPDFEISERIETFNWYVHV